MHMGFISKKIKLKSKCLFQINGVQALAKCTGWTVQSSSNNLGCGPVEPLGNATGCMLANQTGDRFIAVRHSQQTTQNTSVGNAGSGGSRHSPQPPQSHTAVYVASAPCKDFYPG